MDKKIILLGIYILLLLTTYVVAEEQYLGVYKQNSCITLKIVCADCTEVNVTSIMYPNSSIAESNSVMTKTGVDFTREFCNTTQLGTYTYNTLGNPEGVLTVQPVKFDVTNSDSAYSMTGFLASTGLLFFLAILFMAGAAVFDVNRWIIKSVLLIISLLFVIMAISSSMVYILDTNNSKLMSTALIIAISTLSFVFIALFVYYLKAILGAMKDIRKERDSELL